jgi:hypothetical protein
VATQVHDRVSKTQHMTLNLDSIAALVTSEAGTDLPGDAFQRGSASMIAVSISRVFDSGHTQGGSSAIFPSYLPYRFGFTLNLEQWCKNRRAMPC